MKRIIKNARERIGTPSNTAHLQMRGVGVVEHFNKVVIDACEVCCPAKIVEISWDVP